MSTIFQFENFLLTIRYNGFVSRLSQDEGQWKATFV